MLGVLALVLIAARLKRVLIVSPVILTALGPPGRNVSKTFTLFKHSRQITPERFSFIHRFMVPTLPAFFEL